VSAAGSLAALAPALVGELPRHGAARPVPRERLVDRKVAVGQLATSKKSGERRWSSRALSPLVTETHIDDGLDATIRWFHGNLDGRVD
jgi:hypothetical protein